MEKYYLLAKDNSNELYNLGFYYEDNNNYDLIKK